jgi:competence protein ComEC
MLNKRFFSILTIALLIFLIPLTGCSHNKNRRPVLRVTFLDVGQGDSIVIESPTGKVIVVDGGGNPGTDERLGRDPGNYVVVPYLRSRGISTVDLIVPTHPDEDHVQGLNAVVARLNVRAALDGGYPAASPAYQRLMTTLSRRHIPIHLARRPNRIDIGGGAFLEVLAPGETPIRGSHSATNNNSIVLRVVYDKARFLLTGDAEAEEEEEIMATAPDIGSDVLKAGHHGSRWSTSDAFLFRVHPTLAIISCGKNNLYNHPHREMLQRLARNNVRILRTDQNGGVIIETDGATIQVTPTIIDPGKRGSD